MDQPQIPTDNQEVQAEETRLRIKLLRLQYYREVAGVIKIFLQTFKTEAVSLVSGVGTIVLGWYQVKKWVLQSRQEVKQIRAASPARMAPMASRESAARVGARVGHHPIGGGRIAPQATATAVIQPLPIEVPTGIPRFGGDDLAFIGVLGVFGLTMLKFAWSSIRAKVQKPQ